MKASLKLDDQQKPNPIHLKAKIPIAVFGLPFLSGFSATHHSSDALSLSLRTHFPSGPSLKLSYNTPTTTTSTTPPFTVTLKSGVSLFGSPNNSPLIISANFSFSPQNPNPNPNFTIHFKPRFGSFSLRKSISSHACYGSTNPNKKVNSGEGENACGFVPLDRGSIWKDLTVDSVAKDSILSGVLVAAETELPLGKRVKVNLRWGVSVPMEDEKRMRMPYLRVNKIKVERVEFDEVKEENVDKKIGIEGEFEMLKGMCSWMSRELSDLRKENREMRRSLEDVKSLQPLRNYNGYSGCGGEKKGVVENSDGFEQWRTKKANAQKETKQNGGSGDVESELEKAIKAASSSQ